MAALQGLAQALALRSQFAMRLDLEPMRTVLDKLQPGPLAKRVVLIGGTNGKGTTSSFLNAIATQAGLRTGLYTSPHLVEVRERIRLNGLPVAAAQADRATAHILQVLGDSAVNELSYFELLTLVAFQVFAEADLDLAIVEVGLGGRLDATNAIDPDLSVITSLSIDHEGILGDTLAEIASEKAPIARPGRPLLLSGDAGNLEVLEEALQAFAPRIIRVHSGGPSPLEWNAALATQAFQELFPDRATPEVIQQGLARSRWPGRKEVLSLGPRRTLLVDGAHNIASATACAPWLQEQLEQRGLERVPVVVGFSGGRNPQVVLGPLQAWCGPVFATQADAANATPAAELVEPIRTLGFEVQAFEDPTLALEAAFATSPVVLVTGSLYLVGDVYRGLGFSAETLRILAD